MSDQPHNDDHGDPNRRPERAIMTLAKAPVGEKAWVAGYENRENINRLAGIGLAPGMGIKVLQNLAGNIVVGIGESRIGVDSGMAKQILVSDQPFDYLVEVTPMNDTETEKTTLKDLQADQQGKVTSFAATDDRIKKAYKSKLLAMGLTPGTEFTVLRVAPFGDPVEILVRGFKLSLRKDEAAALIVESINN